MPPRFPRWRSFWQDLRYGSRMLLATPGFTIVAVLSLAIGIGANSAIFSFADALLFRPLPVARPGEVLTVGSTVVDRSAERQLARVVVSRLRRHPRPEQELRRPGRVRRTSRPAFATDPTATPKLTMGMLVSGNLLAADGRRARASAARSGPRRIRSRAATPSSSSATRCGSRQFGSDPGVLGRTRAPQRRSTVHGDRRGAGRASPAWISSCAPTSSCR